MTSKVKAGLHFPISMTISVSAFHQIPLKKLKSGAREREHERSISLYGSKIIQELSPPGIQGTKVLAGRRATYT